MSSDEPIQNRPGTITLLLDQARSGDDAALSRAWSILYEELRKVAHNLIRGERIEHQMDATELIGEIWIRGNYDKTPPSDRNQFFNRAFRHMAQELIAQYRKKNTAKRGAGWSKRPLDIITGELCSLHNLDPERKEAAALVMESWEELNQSLPSEGGVAFCRLVLGLSNDATAKVQGLTPKQAESHWYVARARLRRALDTPRMVD